MIGASIRGLWSRRCGVGAAIACAWWLAACDGTTSTPSARPDPAGVAVTPPSDEHENGRAIYNFRCYFCHGYSGDAKTLASSFLRPSPRDFTTARDLARRRMVDAVRNGIPGTAMTAFASTLDAAQIERVVDFVRAEFMDARRENTRYHTPQNGWPRHDRFTRAAPFATGAIPMDRPWEQLSGPETEGKRLYLSSCVSCHDRGRVENDGPAWQLRGVSYPPGNYEHDEGHDAHQPAVRHDAASDPYELHESPPRLARASRTARRGERIYRDNCAHCHAADGSGRNWIGSFLDPPPPDFTRPATMAELDRARIVRATRHGVPGTSMPAWRDVLGPRQIDAVAVYLRVAFAGDAGAERPSRSDP